MSKAEVIVAVKVSPEDLAPEAAAFDRQREELCSFGFERRYGRVNDFLRRLRQKPPQVLLLEGGTQAERFTAGLWWAALINCAPAGAGAPDGSAPAQSPLLSPVLEAAPGPTPETATDDPPCLACPVCTRVIAGLHRDVILLDGRTESIKIAQVRELLPLLGEPPREARRRVVILAEAQALGEAAANALLKSLEEPLPGTIFVLLAPQRERLLPTLVSRSFALTLPWPQEPASDERVERLARALAGCAKTGRGWVRETAGKGAVDAPLAHGLINACRQALVAVLAAPGQSPDRTFPTALSATDLAGALAALPVARLRMLDEELAEAQDCLIYGVNPALVLDRLASRLFLLTPH